MAARSRPRNGQPREDANEERNIWNQVRNDAKRVDTLTEEADVISKRIVELEQEQAAVIARGEVSSASIDDELESLYRDNVRISEESQSILDGDNNSLSIHKSLQLLAALRDASENDNSSSTTTTTTASTAVTRASVSAPKSRTAKRKYEAAAAAAAATTTATTGSGAGTGAGAGAGDDSTADSPNGAATVSSTKGAGGNGGTSTSGSTTTGKLVRKSSASRSGSVPRIRESPVRAADEGADSADGAKPTNDRLKLVAGIEVLYRNKGKSSEGEGILCSVSSVTGEGKQRRYEIKDLDPDMHNPAPYRASVQCLIPIPPTNAALPSLTPRKQVLALYPGTTTFYKAEVVAAKTDGKPLPEGSVRLRFEGEDEADREMDVERRYVMMEGGR